MSSRKLIAAVAATALAAAVATAPAHAAGAPSPQPQGEGIIAILIGLQQFTPPIGSNTGSFIDGSQVYGSAG
jgi:hypothetical protein